MKISTEMRCEDIASPPDAVVRTSSGLKIRVHSSVLAAASPVFERLVEKRKKKHVPILGVPYDAVLAFVGWLYSKSPTPSGAAASDQSEAMDKYGMHLMVLAHVYQVKPLKDLCEVELALRLTVDSVVDVLQLARECDVPRLYLQCTRLLRKEFAAVEKTEAWVFLQENDPWLELDILKFLEEEDMRQKRRRRKMEEQKLYFQLSEAMECLQHICTQGCTAVGPHESTPNRRRSKDHHLSLSCPNHTTCNVLQNLLRHLGSCQANRSSCPQCRRIWDLLRLHSSVCQVTDQCKVPLCRQFKLRTQVEGRGDGGRWRLLAKKVSSVAVMSSLAKKRTQALQNKP